MMENKGMRKKDRITRRKRREWFRGYAFISPWLIGIGIFFLYAAVRSLQFSFHDFSFDNGIKLTSLSHFYDNYIYIVNDLPDFIFSLQTYVSSMVMEVPMIVAFALIIALLLNGKFRGRGLFRTIFFLPVVISTGTVMGMVADGGSGISIYDVTALANLLLEMPSVVYETFEKIFATIVNDLWYSGVPMQIFLAGLQKVPEAQYEAARIDGASQWTVFWKITVPSIRPFVLLNAVYTIVSLSAGSNAVVKQIKQATYLAAQGYDVALAMAWIYALVIILLLLGVFLLLKERGDKHVKYEQSFETIMTQRAQQAKLVKEGRRNV